MPITRLEMVSFAFRFKVKRDRNAGGIAAESERKIPVVETTFAPWHTGTKRPEIDFREKLYVDERLGYLVRDGHVGEFGGGGY
jgi:hypothetical protein